MLAKSETVSAVLRAKPDIADQRAEAGAIARGLAILFRIIIFNSVGCSGSELRLPQNDCRTCSAIAANACGSANRGVSQVPRIARPISGWFAFRRGRPNPCRKGLDRRPVGCEQNRPCWIDPGFRPKPQPEYWTRAGPVAKTELGDRRCFSWHTLRSQLG